MAVNMIFMVISLLVMLSSPFTNAQPVVSQASSPTPAPVPAPAPAPAPAPDYVNLAYLLSVAGPFHTFLNLLQSTKVIKTFQDQANNTEQGITIFVPTDSAFSSLKKPSLSNLTQDEKKSLVLFHGLSQFYTLSDFNSLSQSSPVTTMAGGEYTLNFTDASGTVHLSSGWTNTKVSSSVHSTTPVSLFQVDRVLLPEAIFGQAPPPAPAPAPSPEIAPTADTPPSRSSQGISPPSPASSSHRIITWGALLYLALGISGGLILFF
ncbi:fasciclin-like arabinogalactan protein 7 [Macadamia integrifolia]|uniref:fasciclin-like arabinogalactan protein 7 n=1 Tax=Macadamia integrifolia TaxID=60698 RepID=UPI001C4EFFC6|nr:fasciclin-like arabinogalactan protein 7 [Macadamia integrifolia]XP_042489847.1 fasciclin-like arabinogalactan protein 7 [Macadamia integrifolia]XP_042489852.1 fasciclin-like arabinogalactan protein 7 [Macadamia integrifolia]XP_042489856.1 fasciclin-like arabinogalactan protein 7 [Macadamia integrifolia]